MFVLIETGPAAELLSWRWHDGCHFVSFVMYISDAKFQEHCFNISRDILDWVLNCFSGTTNDAITYTIKTWISLKQKKIFQKGKRHSSLLWKAFKISSNDFLLHRHFNVWLLVVQTHDGKERDMSRTFSFSRSKLYALLQWTDEDRSPYYKNVINLWWKLQG